MVIGNLKWLKVGVFRIDCVYLHLLQYPIGQTERVISQQSLFRCKKPASNRARKVENLVTAKQLPSYTSSECSTYMFRSYSCSLGQVK